VSERVNAKQAKKLRWFARAQEAAMPDIMINKEGIPSTLLVYNHKKIFVDAKGDEHEYINRTIQYNPRTCGKGYYRALKSSGLRLRGSIARVRQTCQFKAIERLTAKQQRAGDSARPDAESLAISAAGVVQPSPPPTAAADALAGALVAAGT
jgi:hypothetical protein